MDGNLNLEKVNKIFKKNFNSLNKRIAEMGPQVKCEIALNKKSKIYFASETVSGRVTVFTKSATNISSMKLSLTGLAKLPNGKNIEIFNETKTVDLNKILPSGTEIFPITWTLPFDILPSYKWKNGVISYSYSALVGVKGREGVGVALAYVKSDPVPIEVYNSIDLNTLPRSVSDSGEYNAVAFFDAIFLKVILNRKCFVPGEYLKFQCQIGALSSADDSNTNRSMIKATVISLFEETSYYKKGRKKIILSTIWRKQGSFAVISRKLNSTNVLVWDDSIKIPNNCGSTMSTEGVLCVRYYLTVCVSTSKFYNCSAPSAENEPDQFVIPIIVGAIPLEQPLKCEVQMALMTSRNWTLPTNSIIVRNGGGWTVFESENYTNGDLDREADDDDSFEEERPQEYPESVLLNRPETPPPSYDAAVHMDILDKPPDYFP